jgi:hypothetical protein
MKYVILNTKIVKNLNPDQAPTNFVTLKIADNVAENDFVAFASNNDEKISDFYTLLKLANKGLPNVVLSLA